MKVIKGYEEINETFPGAVLTIGNYDGLHLGHRKIIEGVVERARHLKGTAIVYTFRPHPHLALTPDEDIQLINTYDEKLDLLSQTGVDVVIEQPFSREFSTILPEKFFRDIVVKRIAAREIHVGYDFGFGRNRSGSIDTLKRCGKEEGVVIHVAKPLKIGDEICSSSRIRDHITSGDVGGANRLLGREFFYRGLVVRGNGRGRKIGFATANVKTEAKLRVKEGVYVTRAFHRGRLYDSVTNVGRQPTFNKESDAPIAVETHIFDFDQDIYGEMLEVRMVARLRDEKRFDGIESLVRQIKLDIERARAELAKRGPGAPASPGR